MLAMVAEAPELHVTSCPLTLLLGISLLGVFAGCGDQATQQAGDRPEVRFRIDETEGTVNGGGLGDSARQVRKALGKDASPSKSGDDAPLDAPLDLTFPASFKCPRLGEYSALRYSSVSFALDGEVCLVWVTGEDAATQRGVRPGDALEAAEEAYPELRCGKTDVGSDEEVLEPACWGRMSSGVYVWFGGDPIDNIEMATVPLLATERPGDSRFPPD